ncbi:hypothetical protein, partial [Yersinia intermedia]|uniref:hypothetical protein n=1 Tax=Yersinia intermedia TaxID=631 RepID=UPI001C6FC673
CLVTSPPQAAVVSWEFSHNQEGITVMTQEEKVKFLLTQACHLMQPYSPNSHPESKAYLIRFNEYYDFVEARLDEKLSKPVNYPDRSKSAD